jgi:outer membrane protein TolC
MPIFVVMFMMLQAAGPFTEAPPVQLVFPKGQAGPPPVMTFQDALERASRLDAQYLWAVSNAAVAREDRRQAKASLLPGVSQTTQYLGTQGNGVTPGGRFVSNDGVHVYRSWAVLHQDLSADTLLRTGYRHAQAGEALAGARVEIAQRGLAVTVTRSYYGLVTAQRQYATAQQAVQQAQRFLDITEQQERAGQAAHSDVLKAQIQYQQQRQIFQDATLAMETARLSLAVLVSPDFDENFTVVDDLDSPKALPSFPEIESMAERENPDLRAGREALRQAALAVRGARNALLPSLSIDGMYGIEANSFASRSKIAAAPELGPLPNLGYSIAVSLTTSLFDWDIRRSKVRQTQLREQQARVELTQAQRQLLANLYSYYNEALTAKGAVDALRRTAELAAESLRLVNLRYQAGESTALEVVDAQKTSVQASNAYNDAQARYRSALATLQTLTGGF